MSVWPGTWSCHVCGAVKPDLDIDVISRRAAGWLVEMRHNLRFCVHDPLCRSAADVWAEHPEPKNWDDGLVKR